MVEETSIFPIFIWPYVCYVIKWLHGFNNGSLLLSAPCLVWCLWLFYRWRYNVCNFQYDLTWSPHCGVMLIYGWELLSICHHPDKSCDHKHCDSKDMFSVNYVTSHEHMFKGLHEFTGGGLWWWATNLSCLVATGLQNLEI